MFFTLLILSLLSNEIHSVEKFICENTNLNVECPMDTILRIDNAVYGRHNSTICPKKGLDQNRNCSSTNTIQILQQRCGGKNNCTFLVSNEIFTDPCVGTYKYLDLNYSCEPTTLQFCADPHEKIVCRPGPCFRGICPTICIGECVCDNGFIRDNKTNRCVAERYGPQPVEEFICENTNLNIKCPMDTILRIDNAIYGRHNSTICPKKGLDQNRNCSSTNATQILQQRCGGKNNCTFLVSNNIFTDPCVGTYKYLDLNYSCEPRPVQFCSGPHEKIIWKPGPCFRGMCSRLVEKECVCDTGYIRDNKTNRCVEEQYGPQPGTECDTHEVYSECGAGCQKTCDIQNPICTLQCVPGYVCAENYVRDSNYNCVLHDNCTCNALNEEYRCSNFCYTEYYEYCNSPTLDTNCGLKPGCEYGCVCKTGYIKDRKTGICIRPQYCPLPGPESKTHEVFSRCGAQCQPTCTRRKPFCTKLCVPGYVCANGYVRNSSTGKCIRPDKCPT